ncbi:hypothetical protein [Sphingomonas sp. RS2018]
MNDTATAVEVTTDGDGRVEKCAVSGSKPSDYDPCASTPVGAKIHPGYRRNGKPVRSVRTMRMSVQTRFLD